MKIGNNPYKEGPEKDGAVSSGEVRIIMAGGGTGGHIFPAIAIANALVKLNANAVLLFVGAKGRMEMEKVPQAGYEIEGLDIVGFNRSSLMKNIGLPLKLVKSFLQVRRILKRFRPDAVVGVGGYSSFPVLRLAQASGVPTFIHESNSFAGKSNMMLGKKATKVFVATDGMEKFFPASKLLITGNPVRKSITESAITKEEAIQLYGLEKEKRTVLVVGGSLGARSINEAIAKHLDDFSTNGLQLIWQTGKTDASKWKELAGGRTGVWVNEFINGMEYAYAAADIVISRAGAMAIAELCVVKKPVIFVPYPYAAEDHQTVNAMNLVRKDAALMVKDSEAFEKVIPVLLELANNEDKQKQLIENIGKYAIKNADERVASEILNTIKLN